ncbi:MAG: SufD family Fe-S cluster assembly protein [Candidatus Shikimatogenerans sp. JK-2022]|nr:SufD family Fe-S cluster assembly protein [Candidatus Shikimatogenerans bostrichidophilus]
MKKKIKNFFKKKVFFVKKIKKINKIKVKNKNLYDININFLNGQFLNIKIKKKIKKKFKIKIKKQKIKFLINFLKKKKIKLNYYSKKILKIYIKKKIKILFFYIKKRKKKEKKNIILNINYFYNNKKYILVLYKIFFYIKEKINLIIKEKNINIKKKVKKILNIKFFYLYIEKKSKIKYIKELKNKKKININYIYILQKKKSKFFMYDLNINIYKSLNFIFIKNLSNYCLNKIYGIILLNKKEEFYNFINYKNKYNFCNNKQKYIGIYGSKTKCYLKGKIQIEKKTKENISNQNYKNYILFKDSSIIFKPYLDILSSNVKCSHGATIGKIDKNIIFYFLSRGISLEKSNFLFFFSILNLVIKKIKKRKKILKKIKLQLKKILLFKCLQKKKLKK